MIRRFILLFIPLVLFSSQQTTLELIEKSKLYDTNRWKALLHYSNKFDIVDNKFIITNHKTLKNEMIDDVKSFYTSENIYKNINNHPQCKFPARFLFITTELNINEDEFPKIECDDFQIYKEKAPADNIYLTYVSENVTNPSSMMGHTFLKFSGLNVDGKKVNHAITFYTIIDNPNPLVLIYQNIFSGMKGMFALQPYKTIVKQYTQKENRNVWEYQLKLSNYERKLIYYHIWELKGVDMSYFFTSYNCSTVIYYTLSLVNSKIYDNKKLWITPLNTVKFLYKYNLIEKSELLPSDEWLVKMIEENINKNDINNVKMIVKNRSYSNIKKLDFYSLKLLSAYSNLEYNKKSISKSNFTNINVEVNKNLFDNKNTFDISKYKSPSKIPNERQFTLGYNYTNKNDYIKLSFLGASHLINDDNREYFGESELKIGYLSILINNSELALEEFNLYSMKSYIPYDSLTKNLSFQFELALKKEYTKSMRYLDTFKIDGGIGIDFLIAKDINIFSIFNGGIGYNREDQFHLFFNPEIGSMIYEVFNMKSYLSYQPLFINSNKIYDKYKFKHNIFIDKNWTFSLNVESIQGKEDYINSEILIKKMF